MSDTTISAFVAELRGRLTAPGTVFEVVEEDVRGVRLPVFRHRHHSVPSLLDWSTRFGDRTYLADGHVRLTFTDHHRAVHAVGSYLQRDHGVAAGDRVAIHAANRWEWIVAHWAVINVGAIPAAFNGWWTAEELRGAAELVEPKVLISDDKRAAVADHAGLTVPRVDLDELAGLIAAWDGVPPASSPVSEDDPAELIFTSGTTGAAKAVVVPHRSVIGFAQVNLFSETLSRVVGGAPVPLSDDELPPTDDVVLVTSPLFHVSMLHGVALQALINGSSFVLLPGRFDPEQVLAAIEREHVTRWLALGSAGPRVATSPAAGRHDTTSVRQLGIGGAPVSPAVQSSLRDAFPSARESLGMGYTSTEAGAVVAGIGGPELLAHPTSTGRANITTSVELRDPDDHAVDEGTFGEVHVRSPYVMLGYWNNPDATAAALPGDGWLAMGDIARFDGDLLHIDSRARDLILVSAENVSPSEVEFRLEAHPTVLEAAVFAVDDPVTGDAVCAVVTTTPGDTTSPDDLDRWCRTDLAPYKVPTRWFVRDQPLPRTASGKLLKSSLRVQADEWFESERTPARAVPAPTPRPAPDHDNSLGWAEPNLGDTTWGN